MKAWLITLEGTSTPKKVISILPPRTPSKRVREHVEQLYVDQFLSPSERLEYLKDKSSITYPAESNQFNNQPDSGLVSITCGHNPWLTARPVQNLKIKKDINGVDEFTWENRSPKIPEL